MKKYIIFIASVLFFGLCVFSYAGEGDGGVKKGPSLEDVERARKISEQQQQRPILPPMVPTIPSVVSPTPSPHIATPQIPQQVISQPIQFSVPNTPQPPVMQNIPSMPKYAAPPSGPVPIEIPNIPVIGNSIGKVTDIGSGKDGKRFIELEDELFGGEVKVNIRDLAKTPIIKQASVYNFNSIKIGDTVNIIFRTEDDENVATFISIMTEEEIEMWNQPAADNPDLTVTPQENNPQPEKH